MTIYFYSKTDHYGSFSNFAPYGFYLDGEYWRTVEHYFQAQKFLDETKRKRIAAADTPKEAKRLGRQAGLREGWDEIRDDVMRRAVLAKFQAHDELRALLLQTGEEELVEASPSDYYWGCGAKGTGKNRLGEILMETRAFLRAGIQGAKAPLALDGLDHVAITVRDIDRAARWYQEVLGLERVHADVWEVPAVMAAAGSGVALFPSGIEEPADPPDSRATRVMRHFAFRVDRANFERALAHFRALGISYHVSDHTVAHSVYLKDPDGYEVELTTYEIP